MKLFHSMTMAAALASHASHAAQPAALSKDEAAIRQTGDRIRDAFKRGDVAAIMAFHHPNVRKALAYDKLLDGSDAVRRDLTDTLAQVGLEFVENDIENIAVQGDAAVEQTRFAIRVSPKDGSAPITFRGRAQIVYVRHSASPTGWASLREVIQPAPN